MRLSWKKIVEKNADLENKLKREDITQSAISGKSNSELEG